MHTTKVHGSRRPFLRLRTKRSPKTAWSSLLMLLLGSIDKRLTQLEKMNAALSTAGARNSTNGFQFFRHVSYLGRRESALQMSKTMTMMQKLMILWSLSQACKESMQCLASLNVSVASSCTSWIYLVMKEALTWLLISLRIQSWSKTETLLFRSWAALPKLWPCLPLSCTKISLQSLANESPLQSKIVSSQQVTRVSETSARTS